MKFLNRILDPLSRFYLSFVVPNQSKLQSGLTDRVMAEIKQRWSIYVSETWEELCRQSVSKLVLDGHSFLPAQRWWQQTKKSGSAEIDIITESADGSCLLIGEAKWQGKMNPDTVLNQLNQKLEALELRKSYLRIYKLICLPDVIEKTQGEILIRNGEFVCNKG